MSGSGTIPMGLTSAQQTGFYSYDYSLVYQGTDQSEAHANHSGTVYASSNNGTITLNTLQWNAYFSRGADITISPSTNSIIVTLTRELAPVCKITITFKYYS